MRVFECLEPRLGFFEQILPEESVEKAENRAVDVRRVKGLGIDCQRTVG